MIFKTILYPYKYEIIRTFITLFDITAIIQIYICIYIIVCSDFEFILPNFSTIYVKPFLCLCFCCLSLRLPPPSLPPPLSFSLVPSLST